MAVLQITEYAELARDRQGNQVPVGKEPAIASQTVTYTTSTNSSAFDNKTRFIRVYADTRAHIAFGSGTQTATATNTRLAADAAEYFGVIGGQQLAAYDGTS